MMLHYQQVGGWNRTFFPNTNITMATSTNTMAKSIDMSDDNLYILINDYVQEPWSYTGSHVNGL